jgi:hypothetical protein
VQREPPPSSGQSSENIRILSTCPRATRLKDEHLLACPRVESAVLGGGAVEMLVDVPVSSRQPSQQAPFDPPFQQHIWCSPEPTAPRNRPTQDPPAPALDGGARQAA